MSRTAMNNFQSRFLMTVLLRKCSAWQLHYSCPFWPSKSLFSLYGSMFGMDWLSEPVEQQPAAPVTGLPPVSLGWLFWIVQMSAVGRVYGWRHARLGSRPTNPTVYALRAWFQL